MYQKLKIWQDSIVLIQKIYYYTELLPKSEEYNLKSQLKRAIVSVTLQINSLINKLQTGDKNE